MPLISTRTPVRLLVAFSHRQSGFAANDHATAAGETGQTPSALATNASPVAPENSLVTRGDMAVGQCTDSATQPWQLPPFVASHGRIHALDDHSEPSKRGGLCHLTLDHRGSTPADCLSKFRQSTLSLRWQLSTSSSRRLRSWPTASRYQFAEF